MSKFTMTHEIPLSQDAFWTAFFDDTLNKKLYVETLAYPVFNIIEKTETDTQILRKLQARSSWMTNVSGSIVKLMGATSTYTEDGVFNKSSKSWTWRLTFSTLSDKIHLEGNTRVEPIDDNKVRRISEVILEVKVFALGGLMESSFEKGIRQEADNTAKFFSNIPQ